MAKKPKYKSDGKSRENAKKCHACLDCRHNQKENYTECPKCGSKNRQYFMSEVEFKRGMKLLLLQDAGTISDLRFQVKYELMVNNRPLFDHEGKSITYTLDAQYKRPAHVGDLHYEDTKAGSFIEEVSRIKIAIFEASRGVKVLIPKT